MKRSGKVGLWAALWGGLGLGLWACGSKEPLVVKQFTVRETDPGWSEDLMVRGEIQKRLYGAIEQKDRDKRRGQYYSVRWRLDPAAGPGQVRFEYRQAATGSQVRSLAQDLARGEGLGVVQFAVAGEAYQKGGRVLAWRMTLWQGGRVVGEQKSFLWE